MIPSLLFFVSALTLLIVLVRSTKIGRRPPDLPPGPPTIPLLGNLHLMPTKNPHIQLQKWAQEYGDTAVKDILDRRSGNYSDRPDMYIGQEIASGGLRLVVMLQLDFLAGANNVSNCELRDPNHFPNHDQKYGEKWRMIHRMIHNILNIKAAVTYVPYQDLENKIMLAGLVDNPGSLLDHLRRYTFSLSTQIIFGFRCDDLHDPRLKQLFWSFSRWGELAGSASAQIVDLFPIIQKLPRSLAPNVRYAERLFKKEKELYVGLWMAAKKGLESGNSHPCFCNDLLRAQQTNHFADDLAGYISGSLLEAGSDTTAAILYGFIQAMVVWPDVQHKVRDEIDRVVGSARLPTIDDYQDLQYVRCCIKESLRWMPTVILGVPHAALKEDSYMGYRIPRGATVINNVWAIHMDPKRSSEPRRFKPERFADDPRTLYESATGDEKRRDNYVFGAGRRLCQGIHIAERSLFLGISRLIWGFEFSPAIDTAGNAVVYDVDDLVGGITVEPRQYACTIKPRSQERAEIIMQAAKECDSFLDPVSRQWSKTPDGMAFSTWVPEKIDV